MLTWRQLSWTDLGMSMTFSTTFSCRSASVKLHENTCSADGRHLSAGHGRLICPQQKDVAEVLRKHGLITTMTWVVDVLLAAVIHHDWQMACNQAFQVWRPSHQHHR